MKKNESNVTVTMNESGWVVTLGALFGYFDKHCVPGAMQWAKDGGDLSTLPGEDRDIFENCVYSFNKIIGALSKAGVVNQECSALVGYASSEIFKEMGIRDTKFNVAKKSFGDIALDKAMIAWNDIPPRGDGRIQIVPWPDEDHWCDILGLSMTIGACCDYWNSGSKQQRLMRLLTEAWAIALIYKLSLVEIHGAFMVIPEYRSFCETNRMLEEYCE